MTPERKIEYCFTEFSLSNYYFSGKIYLILNVFFVATESTVKSLQAALFPPQLTCSGSYFSNFLVKCQYEEDDDSRYKAKETSSKDWCTINKDISFTLQPPRWPTECQVCKFINKLIILYNLIDRIFL